MMDFIKIDQKGETSMRVKHFAAYLSPIYYHKWVCSCNWNTTYTSSNWHKSTANWCSWDCRHWCPPNQHTRTNSNLTARRSTLSGWLRRLSAAWLGMGKWKSRSLESNWWWLASNYRRRKFTFRKQLSEQSFMALSTGWGFCNHCPSKGHTYCQFPPGNYIYLWGSGKLYRHQPGVLWYLWNWWGWFLHGI